MRNIKQKRAEIDWINPKNYSKIAKKLLFLSLFRKKSFSNGTLGLWKSFLNQTTYVLKSRLQQQSFLNPNSFLNQAFLNWDSIVFIILSFIQSFWIELKLYTPKNFTLSKVIMNMDMVNVELFIIVNSFYLNLNPFICF